MSETVPEKISSTRKYTCLAVMLAFTAVSLLVSWSFLDHPLYCGRLHILAQVIWGYAFISSARTTWWVWKRPTA